MFFVVSSTIPTLAIVQLICPCIRPEKPSPVWGACHTWYFAFPPDFSVMNNVPWRLSGVPLESSRSCFPRLFTPVLTLLTFLVSVYVPKFVQTLLVHSLLIILDILSSLSQRLALRFIILYFCTVDLYLVTIGTLSRLVCATLCFHHHK